MNPSLSRRFTERFVDRVVRRPVLVLAIMGAITLAFACQLPKLHSETDVTAFLPQGDESVINLNLLEDIFGRPFLTQILVMREDHPDGIYNPGSLGVIAQITDWLQTRPEFETARNSDLRSLTTVNNILGNETGMVVEPFMEEPPTTRNAAIAIKKAIESNGIYVGMLAASDGKGAAIVVRESEEGQHRREQTYNLLTDYLAHFAKEGRPEKFYVTGRPVIQGLFGIYISEEGRRLTPYVFGLLGLFLFLSFRTLRGLLIPITIIAMTEVWMLGFLGLWGHPVYTVTSILPILIVSIAVAASIHVLARYYEACSELATNDPKAVVRHTMLEIAPPVLMTSLTTAIGFLAMTSSKQVPMADFGVVAAAGIMSSFFLTMTVVPALLAILPLPAAGAGGSDGENEEDLPLGWMLARSTAAVNRNAIVTIGVFVVALATGVFGISRLTTDSSMVSEFPPGHPLRVADAIANEHFAGGTLLDLIIDGGKTGALKDPELLRRIDELQAGLEQIQGVGDTFSIAELVKQMNRVMNEDRAEEYRIPDSHNLVAQYLLLYSMSGDPGDFDDLVDYDYRYAHVTVFLRDAHSRLARLVEARTRELTAALFPPGSDPPVVIKPAGTADINVHLEDYVTRSQVITLAICVPALLVLMWIEFGTLPMTLLAILPVSCALVGIYGTMGFLGVPTDIGTTILGGMSLGIGIDFAIHYLHRYTAAIARGASHEAALLETARTVGRALFYNTVVLIGGFVVLLSARMYPQVKLGALVSATMALCYIATIYLFPAALRLLSHENERTARVGREQDARAQPAGKEATIPSR